MSHADLARRFYEDVMNRGDLAVIDELLTADFVDHEEGPPGSPDGIEGVKFFVTTFREAFPDMQVTIEVDAERVMETLGRGVERGDIKHWADAVYHKRDGDKAPWIAIEERIPGRRAPIKYRLGERALRAGLEARRGAGIEVLEQGTAPPALVDCTIQRCVLGDDLYPHP